MDVAYDLEWGLELQEHRLVSDRIGQRRRWEMCCVAAVRQCSSSPDFRVGRHSSNRAWSCGGLTADVATQKRKLSGQLGRDRQGDANDAYHLRHEDLAGLVDQHVNLILLQLHLLGEWRHQK